jgi:hypothetical protein
VFISYRIHEASQPAEELKVALANRNITSFVSHLEPAGDSIAKDVMAALIGCELFVILGTASYGEDTGIGFSSYNELEFACDERKRRFLIKMCDGDFSDPMTRLRLPKSVPYRFWEPLTTLPVQIVEEICGLVGQENR